MKVTLKISPQTYNYTNIPVNAQMEVEVVASLHVVDGQERHWSRPIWVWWSEDQTVIECSTMQHHAAMQPAFHIEPKLLDRIQEQKHPCRSRTTCWERTQAVSPWSAVQVVLTEYSRNAATASNSLFNRDDTIPVAFPCIGALVRENLLRSRTMMAASGRVLLFQKSIICDMDVACRWHSSLVRYEIKDDKWGSHKEYLFAQRP